MTSGRLGAVLTLAVAAAGCGSSKESASVCGAIPSTASNLPTPTFQVTPGDNVVSISVSGDCGGRQPYLNEPCVSVKVCAPGTSSCQTIGGLLLDTGSYGLRVFKQVLSPSLLSALPPVQAPGGGALAECVKYADLSADWGPVVRADVVLANEPAVNVPIQVIDATFGTVPGTCPSPETAPVNFNGILGVGPFVEDCGTPCDASLNVYFASSGATTTPVTVDPPLQVQNPVGLLPGDGNGIIIVLPGVPTAGAPTVTGSLVLGVGTRSNNAPTSATAIALDSRAEFTTVLNGIAMENSFVDTGSNGLFFGPPPAIRACTSADAQGWYCPTNPDVQSFTATNRATSGGPNQLAVTFEVANLESLTCDGTKGVFSNAAGTGVAAGFDWGLPFFLGRTVYLVMAGKTTPLGTGPILAY